MASRPGDQTASRPDEQGRELPVLPFLVLDDVHPIEIGSAGCPHGIRVCAGDNRDVRQPAGQQSVDACTTVRFCPRQGGRPLWADPSATTRRRPGEGL